MNQTAKLPPLPNSVEEVRAMFRGEFDYVSPGDDYYTAAQMRAYAVQSITLAAAPAVVQAEVSECGACHGSGWVPRDPDIGTDQECFSCNGSGVDSEPAPAAKRTSIDEMCAVLKTLQIEASELTDCTILYNVTFEQIRSVYDAARGAA